MTVDIGPARWWEAGRFVKITLAMVRGRDPWADRILAQPLAPASLLEYAYMLEAFARYDNYIVKVSGNPAGVLSLHNRPQLIYIYSLGILPEYRRAGLGQKLADFVTDYSRRKGQTTAVASMAASNRPAHVLVRAMGGRLLGLSTTSLTLARPGLREWPHVGLRLEPTGRAQAQAAWRRWRLHEVERVAGAHGAEIAGRLLGAPPWAEHRVCLSGGDEIGYLYARRRQGGWTVGLFPAHDQWGEAATLGLLGAAAAHLGGPVQSLTVTQTHADVLGAAWPPALQYERRREQERHLVYFRRV